MAKKISHIVMLPPPCITEYNVIRLIWSVGFQPLTFCVLKLNFSPLGAPLFCSIYLHTNTLNFVVATGRNVNFKKVKRYDYIIFQEIAQFCCTVNPRCVNGSRQAFATSRHWEDSPVRPLVIYSFVIWASMVSVHRSRNASPLNF